MSITLREALPEDDPFLYEVYASSREQELALVPWTEEQRKAFLSMQFNAQHAHYREQYPHASYSVILGDDVPLGRLYVLRENDAIRILDITLLPEYRGNGVGSSLLGQLLEEAAQSKKPLQIYVETFNPSLQLFQRLGFKPIAEEGINFLLEWQPEG
jgi:ribosomal protein S18 acetylase RimI-like enzyme